MSRGNHPEVDFYSHDAGSLMTKLRLLAVAASSPQKYSRMFWTKGNHPTFREEEKTTPGFWT